MTKISPPTQNEEISFKELKSELFSIQKLLKTLHLNNQSQNPEINELKQSEMLKVLYQRVETTSQFIPLFKEPLQKAELIVILEKSIEMIDVLTSQYEQFKQDLSPDPDHTKSQFTAHQAYSSTQILK